jgi:hypothetical protein
MRRHRNPQPRLSKQAPSDNFNFGDGIELSDPVAPPTGSSRRFLLGSSTPCDAPAIEREALRAPDPIVGVIVFGDESTQPHKARADARQARGHRARQARGHRAMSSAGSSRWWRRGATVAGLIVLLDLVFRVLISCGDAR